MKFRKTGKRGFNSRRKSKKSFTRYSFKGRATTKTVTFVSHATIAANHRQNLYNTVDLIANEAWLHNITNNISIESISIDLFSKYPAPYTCCFLPIGIPDTTYSLHSTTQRSSPSSISINAKRVLNKHGFSAVVGFGSQQAGPGGRILFQNHSNIIIGARISISFRFESRDVVIELVGQRDEFELFMAAAPGPDPQYSALIAAVEATQRAQQELIQAMIGQNQNRARPVGQGQGQGPF